MLIVQDCVYHPISLDLHCGCGCGFKAYKCLVRISKRGGKLNGDSGTGDRPMVTGVRLRISPIQLICGDGRNDRERVQGSAEVEHLLADAEESNLCSKETVRNLENA